MRTSSVIAVLTMLTTQAVAHSGGLNKQGCHSGSQPYHCHKSAKVAPVASSDSAILSGTVTHVRDGDTIEVSGIAVRLSALDCPENDTRQGKQATKIAKQFEGSQAMCELTGAKSYDRLVGYCTVGGTDFGLYMVQNSSCKVWEKYDVWDRY
ncbi:thermonuclease family protein [bacterium]|nr:thermonuclease family protein [bacterium]